MTGRTWLALSAMVASIAVFSSPSTADAVSTPCDGLPSTAVPGDAVIDDSGPTRFLADVDGDGHRDVITGYWRGADNPNDAENYLHVELASGWGTQTRIDTLDQFSGAPRSHPQNVVVIAGQRLVVAGVQSILPGASGALFAFNDCILEAVPLIGGGYPDIWSGGGISHFEWFACQGDGIVMLKVFSDGSQATSRTLVGGEATFYRLDPDQFVPAGDVALHLPRSLPDLRAEFPDCSVYVGTFGDDNGSVFQPSIEWLALEGITRGCNPPRNDRYCPTDELTRGEMAAFLVRALGYTDDGGGDLFVDDDGSVFEAAIDKLGTAGVTKGCNPPVNDRYCPDRRVTRAEIAAFLVRALGLTDDGGGDLFVDDDGSEFESSIDRLGAAGITKGCNPPANNRFCPDDYVNRGQIAAFLKRALE